MFKNSEIRMHFTKSYKTLTHILIDKDMSFLLIHKVGMNNVINGILESMKYCGILWSEQ